MMVQNFLFCFQLNIIEIKAYFRFKILWMNLNQLFEFEML